MIERVLAVSQPYASLLAGGYKSIELRRRDTKIRERVLIYASGMNPTMDRIGSALKQINQQFNTTIYPKFPMYAILGSAEIVGSFKIEDEEQYKSLKHRHFAAQEFYDKGYVWAWEFANPVLFAVPIPFKFSTGCVIFAYADIDYTTNKATVYRKCDIAKEAKVYRSEDKICLTQIEKQLSMPASTNLSSLPTI